MFSYRKIINCKRVIKSCSSLFSTKIEFPVLNEPCAPAPGRFPTWSDSSSVIFKDLKNGAKVFIQGASGSPSVLSTHLYQHVLENDLQNIEIQQYLPMGPIPLLNKDVEGRIRLNSGYLSSICRDAVNEGRADFTPICSSELPLLYRKRVINLDYALVMISPPDKHGFCSLGAAVGTARSAIQNARIIIGQINPMAPRTYGDSTIHSSKIDFFVNGPQNLEEMPYPVLNKDEEQIAEVIAKNLIEDGATLQLGFGRIPYAVTDKLRNHKDLGLHSEMFSDSIIDLVELGVLNNRRKNVRRGRIVASYCLGTNKVFDFINENPRVGLYDIAWVNLPEVIGRNPKVTTINTCFEMDLTGQSVGDSQGSRIMTGVGGQLDFTRAASLSADGLGRPIITMTSMSSSGKSNIVPFLTEGGGVVATRAHMHYVVTEYGIAYLFGKCLRQRAHALINIAHPDFRESLEKSAFERLKVMPSP